MDKTCIKRMCDISDEEWIKFTRKLQRDIKKYLADFYKWRMYVREVKEKYNGFGQEILDISTETSILLKNFVDLEIIKSKNKRYNQFLLLLLEEDLSKKWQDNKIIFGE